MAGERALKQDNRVSDDTAPQIGVGGKSLFGLGIRSRCRGVEGVKEGCGGCSEGWRVSRRVWRV